MSFLLHSAIIKYKWGFAINVAISYSGDAQAEILKVAYIFDRRRARQVSQAGGGVIQK